LAEAWDAFCAENGIDPAHLIGGGLHDGALQDSEREMRRMTGSLAELSEPVRIPAK